MQIKFNNIQFTEIDYKVKTFEKSITHQLKTKLNVVSEFSEDNTQDFNIVFKFLLHDRSQAFNLKMTAIAHFSTNESIDETFKNSPFVEINAPAIAFPYVRTFISNLTLNSGFDPIMLPAINFLKMADEKLNKK